MSEESPNYRPALDAAMRISSHFGRHQRRASEAGCSASITVAMRRGMVQMCVKVPTLFFMLISLFMVDTSRVVGQTFKVLHTFTGGLDGSMPSGGLFLSGKTLYGTTSGGGTLGGGSVFSVNIDGSSFETLYSFADPGGANPFAGLILSGDTLYGTTYYGGSSHNGSVFAVNVDGSGFTNLHSFTSNYAGYSPFAALILANDILYGTTSAGSATVFSINKDGSGFTNLHFFGPDGPGGAIGSPTSGLVLRAILYMARPFFFRPVLKRYSPLMSTVRVSLICALFR